MALILTIYTLFYIKSRNAMLMVASSPIILTNIYLYIEHISTENLETSMVTNVEENNELKSSQDKAESTISLFSSKIKEEDLCLENNHKEEVADDPMMKSNKLDSTTLCGKDYSYL